nr:hypothetical protein [uncultured Clostridium sp.]
MVKQNEMDKIVTPMMEHICDHLCRFPKEVSDPEATEEICAECQMGKYVCLILNTYNAVSQLQTAAEVVRNELMMRSDWYRALVNSIYGYLHETDGSLPYDKMAEGLADRIVGIEQDELLSEAGSNAGRDGDAPVLRR